MHKPNPDTLWVVGPPITGIVGSRITFFDEIDSTNEAALTESGDGAVCIAHSQRAGRGRLGRTWHSARGLGLWFSVGFDGRLEGLTFAAALAVRDALRPSYPLTVKWPNDLLFDGRKVCGILAEHRNDRTAVGIGLNLHHRPEDFPEKLRGKATSLDWESRSVCEREPILNAILLELDRRVLALREGHYEPLRQEWVEACNLLGRRIRSGETEGRVVAIDALGALVLDLPGGARRLISGDITVLREA